MPPKSVAIKIRGIRKPKFNPSPEAKMPAVKRRLSPGSGKNIPDSKKTITNTPMYPYRAKTSVILKGFIIAGDEGIEPSPVLLESAVLPLN